MSSRDKRAVAESFSRAAAAYDNLAGLQQHIGEDLLGLLPMKCGAAVLDLGCGTGYFLPALQARYTAPIHAIDLAAGMLDYARSRHSATFTYLQADAENLPLRADSIGLLYSNLALQWCEDLDALFTGVRRVLAPGACAVFSTLVEGTLDELRRSWAAVDDYVHVNHFLPESRWRQAISEAGLQLVEWRCEARCMEYVRLADLLAELKGIGAHNVNQGRAKGLSGKSAYRGLCQAYEQFRDDSGLLPATYQVVFATVRRGE